MEQFLPYAGVIMPVVLFLLTYKIFSTPTDLEKAKADILEKVEQRFVTLKQFEEMKKSIECQYEDIKVTVNKIYDCLIKDK